MPKTSARESLCLPAELRFKPHGQRSFVTWHAFIVGPGDIKTGGPIMRRSRLAIAAMLLCCSSAREALPGQARRARREVPAPYTNTRDEPGHTLVKTEEFVVPKGTPVFIKGLEFDGPACSLTSHEELILTQVFNSLEEITENTVNDKDPARVAEHKGMKFDVRGHSTFAGNKRQDRILSEDCAKVVMKYLTSLGTPAWRLKAKGLGSKRSSARSTAPQNSTRKPMVDFLRTK